MPGIFSKSNRPKRPGAYVNWESATREVIVESSLGSIALPFTHPWGPANTVVPLGSLAEFFGVFGKGSAPSSGHRAVDYAFRGSGVAGEAGAGTVYGYRVVPADAAFASRALSNGAQNALTVYAIYKGSHGNRLNVRVEADSLDPANTANLVVLDGTTELERHKYARADINALAALINSESDWLRTAGQAGYPGGSVTSGTALTTGTFALTGGADGTVVAGDYTSALTAFEQFRFSILTFDGALSDAILASVQAWSAEMNNAGRRHMVVVGGALDELVGNAATAGTAIHRSVTLLNDPNFVNVGVGSVKDERYGVLSTGQLASRVAGILAGRGDSRNITFARLPGIEIVAGPSKTGVLDAIANGVVVLARDNNPAAPVRIEKGVTTFTSTSDPNRPYHIFSVPKFVRTMHSIEIELTEYAEFNVVGNMPVTDATRSFLRARTEVLLAEREARGVIQPGWRVDIDQDPAPTDQDEFIALAVYLKFGRALEQIFYTITVG